MFYVKKDEQSIPLSPEAMIGQKALLLVIMSVSRYYNDDFWISHKLHKRQGGEDPAESVDQLLCDPLCNVCHQQDLQDSGSDVYNAKDTKAFCKFEKRL